MDQPHPLMCGGATARGPGGGGKGGARGGQGAAPLPAASPPRSRSPARLGWVVLCLCRLPRPRRLRTAGERVYCGTSIGGLDARARSRMTRVRVKGSGRVRALPLPGTRCVRPTVRAPYLAGAVLFAVAWAGIPTGARFPRMRRPLGFPRVTKAEEISSSPWNWFKKVTAASEGRRDRSGLGGRRMARQGCVRLRGWVPIPETRAAGQRSARAPPGTPGRTEARPPSLTRHGYLHPTSPWLHGEPGGARVANGGWPVSRPGIWNNGGGGQNNTWHVDCHPAGSCLAADSLVQPTIVAACVHRWVCTKALL